MTPDLTGILDSLSDVQREAVLWGEGASLVLAGPGAGKTRVLTARIAKLLDGTRDRNFRVLALTFTTKAASEMRERVQSLVPELAERVFIGTFHAFCTQLLRQHGSHLGISPDFAIFDQDADREALLSDALISASAHNAAVEPDDIRWLRAIDQLKAGLVVPEKAASRFRDENSGQAVARTYAIYEDILRVKNVLDFNGLILGACRLMRDVPGVAQRTQKTYAYWLIDEFQDTSPAQYRLLQLAAGESFKNLFAVADDDQIIYQWAGASYRQLEKFREDFRPSLIQLVENHRCPAEIVAAANKLVAYNTFRTPEKQPLVASKPPGADAIDVRVFDSDRLEWEGLAGEICALGPEVHGRVAVLGRTRSLLEPIRQALHTRGVKAVLAQRRDRFISPQFTWLQACLDQALRPTDMRVFKVLVDSGNRVLGDDLDPALLEVEAAAAGVTCLEQWALAMTTKGNGLGSQLGQLVLELVRSRASWRQLVKIAVPRLTESAVVGDGNISDAADDRAAWDSCLKEIRAENGGELDLDQVIQGLALRSKEPPRDPFAVTLLTVHQSKGLEFDIVYVVGLAEAVMPSWQSLKKGNASAEMEEERRNCFVAITRTRQRLVLSRALSYQGRNKLPSRFLAEMGMDRTR